MSMCSGHYFVIMRCWYFVFYKFLNFSKVGVTDSSTCVCWKIVAEVWLGMVVNQFYWKL